VWYSLSVARAPGVPRAPRRVDDDFGSPSTLLIRGDHRLSIYTVTRITAIWPYREMISILLFGFAGTLLESKIQIFNPSGGLLFGGKTPAGAYGWKSRTMDGNFYVSGGYSSGRRHVVRVHKKPQANRGAIVVPRIGD
jgi:hypothetical protein